LAVFLNKVLGKPNFLFYDRCGTKMATLRGLLMDNYDKARKVLQSMALSKIAQETGISIGQIWHYRDRHEGIEKAPPAYVERIARLYRKKRV
jgi:hypothetical protein